MFNIFTPLFVYVFCSYILTLFTQGEMFAYLRKEHALSAAQLLGGERAQQQHRAASRVQALARGRRARVYVAGMCCNIVLLWYF